MRSTAKSPRVAEQCDVNIHLLTPGSCGWQVMISSPSDIEDPPCRGTVESVEAPSPPVGVAWKFGEVIPTRV
ncbi:hypothetical protein TNCV_2245401 [Trichonephila clavipes]|nr:hypothetical protein TNCV_2245401 [Trichonephila clavipes]